jgi:hypothetical protein
MAPPDGHGATDGVAAGRGWVFGWVAVVSEAEHEPQRVDLAGRGRGAGWGGRAQQGLGDGQLRDPGALGRVAVEEGLGRVAAADGGKFPDQVVCVGAAGVAAEPCAVPKLDAGA